MAFSICVKFERYPVLKTSSYPVQATFAARVLLQPIQLRAPVPDTNMQLAEKRSTWHFQVAIEANVSACCSLMSESAAGDGATMLVLSLRLQCRQLPQLEPCCAPAVRCSRHSNITRAYIHVGTSKRWVLLLLQPPSCRLHVLHASCKLLSLQEWTAGWQDACFMQHQLCCTTRTTLDGHCDDDENYN